MLARKHRFHGYNAMNHVYKQARPVRSGPLQLRSVIGRTSTYRTSTYRVAVVVSKKVSKSAVTRNRIRRRVFECLRAQLSDLTTNHDIIVSVFDETVATMPADALETTIHKLLSQAHVL